MSDAPACRFDPFGWLGGQPTTTAAATTKARTTARGFQLFDTLMFPPSRASVRGSGGLGGGRLLLLVLGVGLADLRDRHLALRGREDDLAREDDGHGARGRAQEVVDGAPEARLHVLDRDGEVGADLRRAPHAERRDVVADEAAGLH